jgi:Xaa-Pro aminopeptidase
VIDSPLVQTDFTAEELRGRRQRLATRLDGSRALISGAPVQAGSTSFRQSNDFYYLTGTEVPHSYLLIDAAAGTSTLYLPHRDAVRESSDGVALSCEDKELAASVSGVDEVRPVEQLSFDIARPLFRGPASNRLFVPFSPPELAKSSRDDSLMRRAAAVSDPWDGEPSREGRLLAHLRDRFPQFIVSDLSPAIDEMRLIKSEAELVLLRRAGELAAKATTAAMAATHVGQTEREIAALTLYTFISNGARSEGYGSIIASGPAIPYGHYTRNTRTFGDGEMILMDVAPDVGYYTSDMGRMWPVNGRYDQEQRALYGYMVEFHQTTLASIRPGRTPDDVMDEVAEIMRPRVDAYTFSSPDIRQGVLDTLSWRGHLSHPVGMAVHDNGQYFGRPLEEGMVISIDPSMWVRHKRIYVRVEDTVAITADGIENFTAGTPLDLDEVENLINSSTH